MARIRIGIALPPHVHARMQRVLKSQNASQSDLLSAIVSCLEEKHIATALQSYEQLVALEKEIKKTMDPDTLEILRGKSPEEIKLVLAAAKAA